MRWVYRDYPLGHPDFAKAFRCQCQEGIGQERRRVRLRQMDGLKPAERELNFADLVLTDENNDAVEKVIAAVEARRGMVTLTGPPGIGKSTLLMCTVNAAREVNIPSVYTTMADVLDYLRSAFHPDHPRAENLERRWGLLISVEVLALDELDEFSATPWAMERFQRLIDERWRSISDHLTLLATNAPIDGMPPKIASRLRDGRAEVVEIGGQDWRRVSSW